MSKTSLVVLLFILLNVSVGSSQALSDFNTSRFSRVIGMGNAFAGVAENVETTFYNGAGLAKLESIEAVFSRGHGSNYFFQTKPLDFAIAVPLSQSIGTIALSYHFLSFDFATPSIDYWQENKSILRLHYARRLLDNLSGAISLNNFYLSQEFMLSDGSNSNYKFNNLFDLTLSVLYFQKLKKGFFQNQKENIGIGLQINNILGTMVSREHGRIFQNIRAGISYRISTIPSKVNGRSLFSLLTAFDTVFASDHIKLSDRFEFSQLGINFGGELTIMEILSLRVGREYLMGVDSFVFPVTRLGVGIIIPLKKIHFNLDYSTSIRSTNNFLEDAKDSKSSFSLRTSFRM